MELRVITADGRQGVLATPALRADAFHRVEVRLDGGETASFYLRELRIDTTPVPMRDEPQSRRELRGKPKAS